MGRRTRGVAGLLAVIVGAAMTAPGAAYATGSGHAAPGGGAARPGSGHAAGAAAGNSAGTAAAGQTPVRSTTITLITGDVVNLSTFKDGRQAVDVKPAPTATAAHYASAQRNGHLYVYPDSAVPYLAHGLLDQRLFDVTQLAADGYDDAHTAALPLILQYGASPANRSAVKSMLAQPVPAATRKTHDLPSIDGVSVTLPRAGSATFWQSVDDKRDTAAALVKPTLDRHLNKIWLDAKVKTSLDVSVPLIGAPIAWKAGYDGTGVTVAVLDTGIDTTHPDLADRVVASKNFSPTADTIDHFGHGTHVASTIAGSGAASGGRYKGVAPGAKLINGKVLDDSGSGPDSDIIAGMEWAAPQAKIISMSLGGGPSDGTDPTSEAVDQLSAQYGTLFVIAAGNAGPAAQTVASPGAADAALTVGASSKTDVMASFSSRGPRVGDNAVKPEISGPGVNIVAARAAGTSIGTPVGDYYTTLSGTSMATPHVAGSAAILAGEHPDWTGQQIKAALTSTAKALAGATVYQDGSGRVDVGRAATQPVTADVGTLNLGNYTGSYGSLPVVHKTVTYHNAGTADVTLNLALSATSDGGAHESADQLGVSPATLTVPAGGSAAATVTFDPNAGDLGLYSGSLVATGTDGQTMLDAAVGFDRQIMYKLTVDATARDGRPSVGGDMYLMNEDTGDATFFYNDGQPKTFMVKQGTYTVLGNVATMDAPNLNQVDLTAVVRTDIAVGADTTVNLDTRAAKPITVHTPKPTVTAGTNDLRRVVGGHSVELIEGGWDQMSVLPADKPARGTLDYAYQDGREAPQLTMTVARAGVVLHPVYLTPRYYQLPPQLSGARNLPAVYVGAGRPADYDGRNVHGKVALVRNTDGVKIEDQVAAAAAAKAAMVVVLAAGPGVFEPFVDPSVALPTVGLTQAEGDDLVRRLSQGSVTLNMVGTPWSPYRYTLNLRYPNLPDGIDYTVDTTNTGVQHTRVYAVSPNEIGHYADAVLEPWTYISFSIVFPRPFGFTQDRYYTAGDTRYSESFWPSTYPYDNMVNMLLTEKPGQDTTMTYYKAPFLAGTSTVRPPVERQGDKILMVFDSLHDSSFEHVNGQQGAVTAAREYENGNLLYQGPYAVNYVNATTAGPATYRVELDMNQGRPGWTLGSESHSAWTFTSARPTTGDWVPQDVVNARWDLPLDLNNMAPAGKDLPLTLLARTQDGAPAVPIRTVKAWISYNDGGTWKAVPLAGSGGTYTASVHQPALKNTTGFAALKFQITDAHGATEEQTDYRAYQLK